jgi:hypothetical protein
MVNPVSTSLVDKVPGLWRLAALRRKGVDHLRATKLKWPLYDVWRYSLNRESRRLFRSDTARARVSALQRRVISELKTQGISIVSVEELFSKEGFLELQKLSEMLLGDSQHRIKEIQENTHSSSGSDKFYLLRLLGEEPKIDPSNRFLDFGLNEQILGIISGYLGMYSRLLYLNVWCNVPTCGNAVFSQRWHRDPEDKRQVKVFLYLRDVDENTGPFSFIRGTHNGGPYRRIFPQTMKESMYPPENDVERLFKPEQRQVCTGKAGTLVFCDTSGIHKGGHPRSAFRVLLNAVYTTNAGLALVGRYFSISAPVDHRSFAARYAVGDLRE